MAPFGVYVHIPICARRCDYCAFATWTDRGALMPDYAAACRAEIERAGLAPASSVFFGGGTPSLLPARLLTGILDAVDRAPGAEVTVECNPENVTIDLLAAYRAAGVNRVSFGVQSLAPHVLKGLGRTHDPAAVDRAVAAARTVGMERVNLDLIYGGAGERDEDWEATVRGALALGPTHISAYALTIEPGTPLAADESRHPDDDVQADRYLVADALLAEAGLVNYEISNWARPGDECRHNLLYWRQGDYRGIGCAAHSHEDGRRWWNVRTPERYIAAVASGSSSVAASETLTPEQRVTEGWRLSLRTSDGAPAEAFGPSDFALLGERGLVVRCDDRVVLTATGRLLANQVAMYLRDVSPEGGDDDLHAHVEQIVVPALG